MTSEPSRPKNVAIFGSTGSIGTATLDVISQLDCQFRVAALSAHSRVRKLEEQIAKFRPNIATLTCSNAAKSEEWPKTTGETHCNTGTDELCAVARSEDIDIVVAAIVGRAGLESALEAARAGKRLALANKETLVVAGHLFQAAVKESAAEVLPVDSEHSAIFQALSQNQPADPTSPQPTHPFHNAGCIPFPLPTDVQRVILTASGGALRDLSSDELPNATVEQVLAHPNWKMGKKITVDSATMMNKALEIIEAKWLFGLQANQISVVIHPQSIIHSMVEYCDGSVLAQLSPPDMRLPIQLALTYPARVPGPAQRFDWSNPVELNWKPADLDRYPALRLGYEVIEKGGSTGAVLNAANEAAVANFLDGRLKFTEIVAASQAALQNHTFEESPSLAQLVALDRWARNEVERWGHSAK